MNNKLIAGLYSIKGCSDSEHCLRCLVATHDRDYLTEFDANWLMLYKLALMENYAVELRFCDKCLDFMIEHV